MTENARPKKLRVLCVDDDPSTILRYREYFDSAEYQLRTAENVPEGLATAQTFMPDLIISAAALPEVDGFEFCQQIRAETALATCIFIVASASGVDALDRVKGLEAGADDCWVKPFEIGELQARVKAFGRIKRLQDELLGTHKKLDRAFESLNRCKVELEQNNVTWQQEKQMLQSSLKQISLMVKERERSHLALEQLNYIQKKNFDSLISILAAISESKRQYHRGHNKKVAEICVFIARELELDQEEVRRIETAALLHEIGKLSIPEELSMKNPETYTQAEKDFMLQHPVKGASLLAQYAGFEKISQIIRHFHENVDGTGVPDGLKDEEIPLGSRILSVAGFFDNIVFRKRNGTVEEAFLSIEAEIGSRFDAATVHPLHKYARRLPLGNLRGTRELRIYELEPGMTLASGIFTESGIKLLPVNTVLTSENIGQIAHYNKKDPLKETVFVKELD